MLKIEISEPVNFLMKHLKRIVSALATAALVVAAVVYAPVSWFPPVLAVLMLAAMAEFFVLAAKKTGLLSAQGFCVNLGGVLVLAFAFSTLALIAKEGGNMALLYTLAVVKLSDMGGFALGVAFGKHKMCPSISPNKTWEGMCGSILGSTLMSCLFVYVIGTPSFALWKTLFIGVVAAFVGTAGDLVESKFKRWVGVKDSGAFMPAGLGGLLDMFDSLLFAPAVIWGMVKWLNG